MTFLNSLQTAFPVLRLSEREPMSAHTSFRIGGNVDVMAFPKNREELAKLLKTSALLDCKLAILGAGAGHN